MIAWFARNGVAANLLMLLFVLGGLSSYFFVKRELFPDFSLDTVIVRVAYPGASPEEIESSIVIRVEEAVEGIDGVKEIVSTAREGMGSVSVVVDRGARLARVKDEVKTRVDAISAFPEQAERPVIEELLIQKDVIRVAVHGEADEASLKRLARRVRDDLANLEGISQVVLQGERAFEVAVEIPPDTLLEYGLTLEQVAAAIRANSLDLPGGIVKAEGGEIQIRSVEQAYTGEEFADIVLLADATGAAIRLGDIAATSDAFVEEDRETRFNGEPAVHVLAREVGDENPLRIADLVYDYVEEAGATWLPDGIKLTPWSDSSYYLQGRINMLLENGFYGFLLVLLVLSAFLRPSLAFFVAIGIPVSFLATLAVGPLVGITVNLLSLFAFILVLGIVVDDAIVVGESVFTEFQKSGPGLESAIAGSRRVAMPVTFAVITTAVAFIPVFFLPGTIGKFMGAIPVVVMAALLFSLAQSKLVLPYHLSLCRTGDRSRRGELPRLSRWQRQLSDRVERFIVETYQPLLRKAVQFRYTTVAAFLGLLALCLSFVILGWTRFVFFPAVPSDFIFMELEMKPGAPFERTGKALDRLDRAIEEIRREALEAGRMDPVKHKASFLGFSVVSGGPNPAEISSGSNIASIILELSKSEIRDSSADKIAEAWRERAGAVPGARKLNFISSAAGPTGLPVDIQLVGRDFDALVAASRQIQGELARFEGLRDIRDTYAEGRDELKLRLLPQGRLLGLDAADLARQARHAFYGAEAQRVQREEEEVKVMVRYPRPQRETVASLRSMLVATPDGRRVPISEVAAIDLGVGYATISRKNGQRTVNAQADADKEVADLERINAALYGDGPGDPDSILGRIARQYPGVRPVKSGEAEDMAEAKPALVAGSLIVVALIYALLAIPFRSYGQPLIVICVIPFSVSGAILGHLITGQTLSLLSLLGIIALAGVVVNDSLVLVVRINELRAKGMPLGEAILEGGQQRFRAILLTSLTTFAGLIPLLLERSLQAQFLIPMATSLAFGVLFATFLTLLLVPCAYLLIEDAKRLGRWWLSLAAQPSSAS